MNDEDPHQSARHSECEGALTSAGRTSIRPSPGSFPNYGEASAPSASPTAIRKDRTPAEPARFIDAEDYREEWPFNGQLEALSYIGITSREAWEVSAHVHDHFELCYIDEGEGWFALDGRLVRVSAGDVFVTKPGEVHQGAASGDRPYRLYYAGFRLNGMPGLEDDYYRLGHSRAMTDEGGAAKALFDQLFHELLEPQPHGALVARSCFAQLLVLVIRSYARQSPEHESRSGIVMPPVVKELLEELHALEGGRSGIDALAKRYHVSRTHLEREFKRCLGLPLGRYMREMLVERSKYWLRQPGQTATETAERLGFSGIHAFSVFFKRHTGVAPADFRKSVHRTSSSQHDEKR